MKYRIDNTFKGSFFYIKSDKKDDKEQKYDVTGYESLARLYTAKRIGLEELKHIIRELAQTGMEIEERGLDINGLILNPECVFVKIDKSKEDISIFDINDHMMDEDCVNKIAMKVRFIYFYEDGQRVFDKRIKGFSEFIIEHVNYDDRNAVDLAYSLYMQIHKGNYRLMELI